MSILYLPYSQSMRKCKRWILNSERKKKWRRDQFIYTRSWVWFFSLGKISIIANKCMISWKAVVSKASECFFQIYDCICYTDRENKTRTIICSECAKSHQNDPDIYFSCNSCNYDNLHLTMKTFEQQSNSQKDSR